MSLVSLLVMLIVVCAVFWAARAIMAAFGVGDPIRTVVMVILVLLFLFWLLGVMGVVAPISLR